TNAASYRVSNLAASHATAASSMNSLMITFIANRVSALHAPSTNSSRLDGAEDHVLDQKADDDHGKESRKHVGDFQLVLVLIDEPAQAPRAGRHAEHQLGRDQRAPGKSPADFEPGENAWKRSRDQDSADVGKPAQAVVASDHAQGVGDRQESRVGVERDRPQ